MNKEYYDFPCSDNSYSTKAFDIRDYVQFDHNGRAECPHCTPIYNNKKKPLQVTNGGDKDGAYHCFRCQDPQAIREALGVPKPTIIPTNLAKPASLKQDDKKSKNSPQKYLVDLASITDDCMALLNGTSNHAFQALKWLKNRGILAEIVREYKLGLVRSRYKNNYYWSISIPILDEGKYHRKKRLIPWEQNPEIESNRPWSQAGIPAMPYFTHKPKTATQTWLCEGEWDAILLGWLVKHFSPTDIAVCTFTSGASNLPGKTEEEIQANLEQLPGQVKIFYDRNDKPDPLTGRKAAEEGARKVAQALKGRGAIAKVPMAKDCTIRGWDVSDAINAGYRIEDFEQAASQAKVYRESRITNNKINKRAMTSRNVFDTAPDYVEELWSGLFACNEMYLLAAPPRVGKSLFTLALAKAVATGTEFLGRPTKKGKVLLISKEDPNDKLKERMSAQDWGDEELDNISFLKDFTLDDLPDLIEYIEEEKPALLVLDTLSSVRTDNIDENSAKLSSLLTPLQKAAQENETCVLIVHHTSKGVLVNATTQEIFDKVRGSGALRGVCRGMIVLAQGEQYVRMVSEGGRYPVQELKIKLDPTDLIWKDLGKWRPPGVDRSQKQQVLQWLAENKQGQVVQIAEELNILSKTVHKILTRLIAENLARKEGRGRKTLYYIDLEQLCSTRADLSNSSNLDVEIDRDTFSTKSNFSEQKMSGDHERKEMLPKEPLSSVNAQNPNFCRTVEKGEQSLPVEETESSTTNSTNTTLSNNSVTQANNEIWSPMNSSGHFGNTTKNFLEATNKEKHSEDLDESELENEKCTNDEKKNGTKENTQLDLISEIDSPLDSRFSAEQEDWS